MQTGANASLRISILDCDGVIDPNAPTSATADSSGYFLESWAPRKAGHGCRSLTATVTSTLGSQQASATSQFTMGG
ncbi:MAG: hypothetical protein H0U76_31085 [Ktedonobacteraceae bacterium]|nr:hypothetical protein [Ktedonobacteraceae bacterium]